MTWTDRHLPSWVDRSRWEEHQLPIYNQITDALDAGNQLVLLDDPPGGGKSLLAYMAHRHVGGSAYYLVGTKYLQGQIERSLPGVSVIKGKRNYRPTDVDPYIHGDDVTCEDCDKDGDDCSFCLDVNHCTYRVARDEAAESSLPCANYKYALGEWSSPRSKFRHRDLTICDEADTLMDELRDYVSVTVPLWMQRRFYIDPPDRKTVESSWPGWFEYAIPRIKQGRSRLPTASIKQRRIVTQVQRLIDRMEMIAEDLDGWVYDYDTKRALDNQSIEFKPVVVDKVATDALWSRSRGQWLAMSGSLGAPEQFVKDLGFTGQYAYISAPSTFPVAHRPIYVAPFAKMTYKKEDGGINKVELAKMGQAVDAALRLFPDQRILILPHSYTISRAIYDRLVDHHADRLFAYWNAAEREEVVEKFNAAEQGIGPVLLAPSLGRGYDNPELNGVIICKVPYPFKGSKQIDKRSRMDDGTLWYANETAKDILQNYGRACRSETNKGWTLILDSKFGEFFAQWTYRDYETHTRGHRLFPQSFVEALDENSDVRFDLRAILKSMTA